MNQVSKKRGNISTESGEPKKPRFARFSENIRSLCTIGEVVNIGIPHVGEQIFQHLNADDLIQCMKVSKVWHVLAEKVFLRSDPLLEAARAGRKDIIKFVLENYYREELGLNARN